MSRLLRAVAVASFANQANGFMAPGRASLVSISILKPLSHTVPSFLSLTVSSATMLMYNVEYRHQSSFLTAGEY